MFIFMRKMNSSRWKDAGLVLAYMIFYLCFFNYLEHRTGVQVHMLQMRADYKIPFCEYFIVPYLLWFPYVGLTAAYFTLFNDNRTEFYQFAVCMGIGMTLFLIVSYIFPNGQNLRPYTFARHNIFTECDAKSSCIQFCYVLHGHLGEPFPPEKQTGALGLLGTDPAHHRRYHVPETAYHSGCCGRSGYGADLLVFHVPL